MQNLRLPGLMTGIDTGAIIKQLMAFERRTLNRWESRKDVWEEKQSTLSSLEGKLSTLRSSVRALSDSDELKAYNVSTSDEEKVTAEATNSASEGSHNIVINQLANAERWVHTAGFKYEEDLVSSSGPKTFIYSYNNKETSIPTTDTTTLSDLVGLINNDANNPGVNASLLYYNDAYHLMLNGKDAGTDYEIKVNSGDTEVMKSSSELTKDGENATLSTKIIELTQFSGSISGGSPYIRITGTDHFGNAAIQTDLYITDVTKIEHLIGEINDAFGGRAKAVFEDGKIVLTDSKDGNSSLSITLTYVENGSTSSLSNLTLAQTNAGTDGAGDLSGFSTSDFTLTQAAQDSRIQFDGLPPGTAIQEVQTVSLATAPDNVPDSGTFTLTYRGETTSDIAWNASADDIKTAFEALSTVNENNITVSGSIADNVTFTFASALGNVDLIMINSSLLDGVENVTASIAETVAGSADYISTSSNTVAFGGVTLHLHDTTTASGESITLTRDIQSVKDKIDEMVVAYNVAINYIKENTGYNADEKKAGVLMGDYIVSTIKSQFRIPLLEQTAGFLVDDDSFLSPIYIGFEFDSDGLLNFDANEFDEAIAEDYKGVLELIGARNIGSSSSDDMDFYGATDYTIGGAYEVKVTTDGGGAIQSVEIKLTSESSYRTMDYSAGTAMGTDSDYAEFGLQLSINESNLSAASTVYKATVNVKQGFTGKMEDAVDRMLAATNGSIFVDQKYVKSQIEDIDEKIEDEEYRLDKREQRLVLQFARLEKTLALLQNQMGAAGILGSL